MIILGSKSPRRFELLSDYFDDIKVIAPEIDEQNHLNLAPEEYVKWLSRKKAEAVIEVLDTKERESLIVAADTIVVYEHSILEKPRSCEENLEFLIRLNGKKHSVYTAFTLCYQGEFITELCSSEVEFWECNFNALKQYTDSGIGLDKAGGYGIQGSGKFLVKGIVGDFYSIMGFPISRFIHLLGEKNWHISGYKY